jgi:hypothetical protein
MDTTKKKEFKNALYTYRDFIISGLDAPVQEKNDILERILETWYEPMCFEFNLLAMFNYPKYIKSQYDLARETPKDQIWLWYTPGMGQWVTKQGLYTAIANMEKNSQ